MTFLAWLERSRYLLGESWRQRSGAPVPTIDDVIARVEGSTGPRREEVWSQIVEQSQARDFLELGVLRGAFAEHVLRHCRGITRYYMLDPWQHLEDWNKPANVDQTTFEDIYSVAMGRTDFARERRIVLRGKTTDIIDKIPDAGLDIAYIDGDHTLRGIAIDLIRTYAKVRPGGILGGDDYTKTIWQHADHFEPSLVCPFAAYFAEAKELLLSFFLTASLRSSNRASREIISGDRHDAKLRRPVIAPADNEAALNLNRMNEIHEQTPWGSSSLTENFEFVPDPDHPAARRLAVPISQTRWASDWNPMTPRQELKLLTDRLKDRRQGNHPVAGRQSANRGHASWLSDASGIITIAWSIWRRRRCCLCASCAEFRASPCEIDDIVKLTETNARIVAQPAAGLCNLAAAFRLVANDIQAFVQTVIVVAEQQCVLFVL
jgi:hypothetical protein